MIASCYTAKFIHYLSSDPRTAPPEYQSFYTEKLALVPYTYLVCIYTYIYTYLVFMYIYVCICMYVCIYVYTYINLCIFIYIYICIYIHTYIYIYIYIYIPIFTHTDVYINTYTNTNTYIHVYTYMYILFWHDVLRHRCARCWNRLPSAANALTWPSKKDHIMSKEASDGMLQCVTVCSSALTSV